MTDVGTTETVSIWTAELRQTIGAIAHEAGFDAFGIARVGDPSQPDSALEAERFAAWVDAGRAGEMGYLQRRDQNGELVRGELLRAMPWARSVIVCALNYNADAPRSIDPASPGSGWIARYAWSGKTLDDSTRVPSDYHEEMMARLRVVEAKLLERAGGMTERCYVDTGPILERSYAAKAAIGWIGKNTCVINQQLGSWLLLGVIVTSLAVEENTASLLAADRCGTCTRCIDACPTDALLATTDPHSAREMDASRCISYLTIEKKGAIEESLREPMGRNVFGCDICQDVCPWNRRALIGGKEGMEPRPELINPALEWLGSLSSQEFKRMFKGSPLERTGRKRLLRNAAIAMGNSGDERYLPQLNAWASGRTGAMNSDGKEVEDPALRDTAEWARKRILALREAADR
jgi:epoxyqueuosine reductase